MDAVAEKNKILIVDDNPRNLFSFQAILGALERDIDQPSTACSTAVRPALEMLTAVSGEEALRLLLEHPDVALILMDVQMPGMDGFETTELIRGQPRFRDVPILFITAVYRDDAYARLGFQVGASDYITKPVDSSLLTSKVNVFLTLQNQKVQLARAHEELLAEIAERKRVEEQVKHLNAVLRAIRSVNQLIVREKDHDLLVQGACDSLVETRGYLSAWIALTDTHGGATLTAQAGLGDPFTPIVELLEGGNLPPCARRALEQPGVVVIENSSSACTGCPLVAAHRGQGTMTVRLTHGDTTYGVLAVSLPAEIIANEEEQSLFEEVAGDLAFALHGIELEQAQKRVKEALEQYAERLRTLHAIDRAILDARSPEAISQAAMRYLQQLVPYQRASVLVFDLEAAQATVLAAHGNAETAAEAGIHVSLDGADEAPSEWRHPFDVELLAQGGVQIEQALQNEGARAYQMSLTRVNIPLIADGELIGVLNLEADSPDAFTSDHADELHPADEIHPMDIAREVADQVAVALRQASLRRTVETRGQQLQAVVAYQPEGLLLLDQAHRVLLVNPAAEAALGCLHPRCPPSAGALVEVAVGHELVSLGERPIEELLQPIPEGQWHELEIAGPPRRIFQIVGRPLAEEAGTEGWILVIRDITGEREAEQRIQQQERLAVMGQLAGGIAHDFNNLLTTIIIYAQMSLGKPDLPPDVKQALETMGGEAQQAAKLIGQILDFSRRSPMETRPLDLRSFIKEAVHILERTIPESISFVAEMEPGEYTVNADPTRIQQVLMNLVVNARDAMPGGGVLRIGLSHVAESLPPTICLSVSDTGTGIPPDVLPHMFEPFFTTKERGEGTGLGLAQVHGIVAQHSGHIDVDTEVGQGTTFRIYLPACQPGETESLVKQTVPDTCQGKGETILLVEDSERIREVGRRLLESMGYQVLTASNGREALEVYRSAEGVDLVITDIVMPEMGGKELVQELTRTNPALKALAITGYVMEKDINGLRETGFLSVIHKPFEADTLALAVRQALDTD